MAGEKVPSVSVVRRHFQPSLPSFRRFNPSGLDDEAVTTSNGLTTRNYRDVEGQNVRTTITRVGGASTISPSGKRGGSSKTRRAARNYKRGLCSKSVPKVCLFFQLCSRSLFTSVRSVSRKLRNKQRNGR